MDNNFLGAPKHYARWAKTFDVMVGSKLYNKIFWGTRPGDHARFAARTIGSASGPLLEVAESTAQATAALHIASSREPTLVDMRAAMFEIAGRSIAGAAGGTLPHRISLERRDMLATTGNKRYETTSAAGCCT